jgi:hypothetical protein
MPIVELSPLSYLVATPIQAVAAPAGSPLPAAG